MGELADLEHTFAYVASGAQVWVTFVLFSLGIHFTLHWWRVRARLEKSRATSIIAPPDIKESKLAALLASGMLGGTVVSFGVVVVEAFWGSNPVAVPLGSVGCVLAGYYFVWRLCMRADEKLRISQRPRYALLRSWRVPEFMKSSGLILVACAPAVLILGLAVPATDPRMDLTAWGFTYRWIACGPSIVFLILVASLWAEAARGRVGGELQGTRWRCGAVGTVGFITLWVNILVWPYVALYFPESWAGRHYGSLERLLEAPIFAFIGIAFFRCFTAEFRSGVADKRLQLSISFRRLSEKVSFVLSGWAVFSQKLSEDYYESSRLLEKTLSDLEVDPVGSQLAADALALGAAQQSGEVSQTDLRRLHLHQVLVARQSVPRRSRLGWWSTQRGAECTVRRKTALVLQRAGMLVKTTLTESHNALFAGVPVGLASSKAGPNLAAAPVFQGSSNTHFPGEPPRINLLAQAAASVTTIPTSGEAPDMPGHPLWEQAYIVVAALAGQLPTSVARSVLDPDGKNHTLKVQRCAFAALMALSEGDPNLLRQTRAYTVLSQLFGPRCEEILATARRGNARTRSRQINQQPLG